LSAPAPQPPDAARVARVRKVAKEWRASLINVSGSNRLLFYKDLKVGTLDLTEAHSSGVGEILRGNPVRPSRLFSDAGRLLRATRALKAISGRARVVAEEFGIPVSAMATGFATWTPDELDDPARFIEADAEQDGDDAGDGRPRRAARTRTPRVPSAPVLLRPVDITARPGSVDAYEIAVVGEPELNPVLLHLLEATYGLQIDDQALLEESGGDSHELFTRLTKIVADVIPGFRVEDRSVIGNFFYAEQPMVEDLEDEQAEFLAASDVIAALAGDETAAQAARGAGGEVALTAPDIVPPSAEHLVLDADGSQSYVINAIAAGQNLVVQGPPGTGKSQTIANTIAELAASGKSVLFVAQKRAAITAVLRRLDSVGLGDIALDLFAASRSRKAVVAALGQAIATSKTVPRPRLEALHEQLQRSRDGLVQHCHALHEPRAPWGLGLHGTGEGGEQGRGFYDWAVATRHAATDTRLPLGALSTWTEVTHDRLREDIAELAELGGLAPDFADRPGWAVRHLRTPELVAEGATRAGDLLDRLLPQLRKQLTASADAAGVPVPDDLPPEWVQGLLELLARAAALHGDGASAVLNPAAVDDDALGELLFATGDRAYRKQHPRELGLLARRRARKRAHELLPEADPADRVHALLAAADTLRRDWREWAPEQQHPVPVPGLTALQAAAGEVQTATAQFAPFVQNLPLATLPVTQAESWLGKLRADRTRNRLPRIFELRHRIVEAGAVAVLEDLRGLDGALTPELARDRLSHAFAMTVIEHLDGSDPRMAGFDAADLQRWETTFAARDVENRQANVARIRRTVAELLTRTIDNHPTQAQLINYQVKRKRGFKPVRELFGEAHELILAAKPVWALSPQMVSELLPAARLFDVVIFDEASQVLPAAAIPAISRAKQVVVAGDSLQLPPTTLFSRTVSALEADDDDDLDIPASEDEDADEGGQHAPRGGLVVRDMESILDALELKLGRERSRHLAWHYRSRDEKLIATSNTYVYKPRGRLMTTFPAADSADALRHDAVAPSAGLGPTNKSPIGEVNHVADLVTAHAREHPEDSLGVIAFGSEHARRIEKELERRAVEDEELDAFLKAGGDEPFFVKNIERVQGDEREVVILTVGYARGTDGRLSYRWGPVLQDGGHRRVNVAISRARSRMVLVTSFTADEVDQGHSDAEGFQLMYRFITFAASGGRDFGDDGAQPVALNPFEYDIYERLVANGLDVVPQWGVGGYRLDFAVRDPRAPGRFLLAVEADGAAYHSGVVARERDRLRQEQLERRGWHFVRIWSTDWFYDPQAQLDRVLAAYEHRLAETAEAPDAGPSPASPPASAAQQPVRPAWDVAQPQRGPRPAVPRGLPIGHYTDAQLQAMVRWVLSDDLPHTRDETFETVKAELGFQRNGKNIVDRINGAIAAVQFGL
jgi:very-short-patch-repair endonuclease